MSVNIGSNLCFGVPFPLVLADRFFAIYEDKGRMLIDVFRWDEATRTVTFEVFRSVPQADHISTNPTGIVTVTNEDSGAFLYKFRPKPGISPIFGKVPVEADIEVRIKDDEMVVTRDGITMATVQGNMISGCAIGYMIGADGSLSIGVNWLPPGMQLSPSLVVAA